MIRMFNFQVSLSLEEKQRIAKQQEQQRFQKIAKPVDLKTQNNPTKPKLSNEPKDLTSSLMQSNMMGLASSASKSTGSLNSSPGLGLNSMANSNKTPAVYGNMSSGFAGVMPTMNQGQTSNSMFPQHHASNQSSNVGRGDNSMDLSSFDSLLSTNSKPKLSMNQMTNNSGQSSFPMQQGMMGNISNRGVMGNQGMMGQQTMNSGFGNQSIPSSGFTGQTLNSGFMGSTGFQSANMFQSQPMTGQNMFQSTSSTSNNTNDSTAKNQLQDLFG